MIDTPLSRMGSRGFVIFFGVVLAVMFFVVASLPLYPEVEGVVSSVHERDGVWEAHLHGHPGEVYWSNDSLTFEAGEEVIMFIEPSLMDYHEIKRWFYPWEDVRCVA